MDRPSVIAVQLDITWEDKSANHTAVRALLEGRDTKGALIVLPEMFDTGFTMNAKRAADGSDRASQRFLSELAESLEATVIGGVVTWHEESRLGQNEAVVYGPNGAEVARYRKMKPFSFVGEDKKYRAGERPVMFEWGGTRISPFVCYDLRFPELFRPSAHAGAEVLVVIANWPAVRTAHWELLLRARAVENQAIVVGVNRCGDDPHVSYLGKTVILDWHGEPLADGGSEQGLVAAQLPLDELRAFRDAFPVLRDLKPDPVPSP